VTVELRPALLASAGGGRVAFVHGLEAAWPGACAVGPALTVRGAAGDNLALHRAIAEAAAGAVIVATVGEGVEIAHVGDLLARAAQVRGVAGIVLDGAVRDRAAIAGLRFSVFHRGTSPRGPAKAVPGELHVPIELRGVPVHDGDLVAADDDGVVVVPAALADELAAAARALAGREADVERRIDAGQTTLEIFGLDGGGRP
jgi:4-hydroxy-4-methyl-2-oxoglutarate aldolase